jgi:pimeloyl-ACP methyl ester carboxylesterase
VVISKVGVPLQRRTNFVNLAFKLASDVDAQTAAVYADRFRDPVVANAARDTYRTFWLREILEVARNPETRRATTPIRALFGTGDVARPSFVAADTANADDYTLETVDASHFIIDERPDLVRAKLVALAEETQR